MLTHIEQIGGRKVLAQIVDINPKELRSFAEALLEKMGSGVVILGSVGGDDRCQLIVQVSDDLVSEGISAAALVKEIAPMIGGSGGGKAHNAQAGGKEPAQMAAALKKGRQLLDE